MRVLFASLLAATAGCTFAGLGDYDIGECNPSVKSLTDDICNQFNSGNSCEVYQCDPIKRRCVLGPRDEDRDGDPANACGGADCDEHDPSVSSLGHEVCDGKDNDCDDLVDEGVLVSQTSVPILPTGALPAFPDVSVAAPSAAELMGTYIAKNGIGTCLQAVSLGATPGALLPECSFLTDTPNLAPRQPSALPLAAGGGGVVFVRTDGCATGALSYRYTGQGTAGMIDQACTAPGVANPSWLPVKDGTSAIVTWFAVSLKERDNPLDPEQCSAATPSALHSAWVDSPASGSPVMSEPVELTSSSGGLGPASLARGGDSDFFVAAPVESDAGIWRLSRGKPLEPPVRAPGLAGAKSVGIALHPDDTTPKLTQVALVAEIGCTPQSLRVVFGTMDDATGEMTLGDPLDVLPEAEGVATRPTVTWVAPRREWLVSWITGGPPRVRGRRFTLEGTPIDLPLTLGEDVIAAGVGEDGLVGAFDVKTSTFEKVAATCHP